MTKEERDKLQQEFCVKTVQDMSEKDRISFAYNVLMDSYYNYTDEHFLLKSKHISQNYLLSMSKKKKDVIEAKGIDYP